ncbi:GTPase ObgE [compost metagenome]
MFIDRATIKVKSGAGGNGAVAFRREKYVPHGGPSGGDGGNGGSVVLRATEDLQTLLDFRYKKEFVAEPGGKGENKNMTGKNSPDLVIKVPCGTVVYDADSGDLLADLSHAGDSYVAAAGGKGGRGNQHFATPTNRAPQYAEPGGPDFSRNLRLELKLLADVGLVGLPNAGKSTLISVISAAKPKIADYPFTTLQPQLGVVQFPDGDQVVVADIPGLIEGAHTGAGLGHEFLRHVERTRILLHVLDASGGPEGRDPLKDWETINAELAKYSPELAQRPMVAVLNKLDLPEAQENLPRLTAALEAQGCPIFTISAATREGLTPLLNYVRHRVRELPPPPSFLPTPQEAPKPVSKTFTIHKQNGVYVVRGEQIERLLEMTNMDSPEALLKLQRAWTRLGLTDALLAHGIQDGDTVQIGSLEFDFVV